MAIQAHLYPENLGLPISSQDYFFLNNNINNNSVNNNNNMMLNNSNNLVYNGCGMNELSFNNLQQKLVQQQQQQQQLQYQQQQQQYLIQLQNLRKRNASFVNVNNTINNNNNSLGFSQPSSKKQKLVTDLATTTTTTTATTASTITSESDNNNNIDLSMNISQSLSAQLEKQRQEIDRYITLQNERLKLALQEQRKQQFGAIIKKFEAKAMELLRQKDEEIAEANKKSMDLQEMVRKLELENQAWQRVALENEAMVFSLSNTLEKLKEQQNEQQQRQQEVCSSSSSNCVDDAESCCNEGGDAETGENRGVFGVEEKEASSTRTTTQGLCCKVCKSRNACVLLLPCRHMCCCNVCDAVLDACPLCKSPKKASIVALIS